MDVLSFVFGMFVASVAAAIAFWYAFLRDNSDTKLVEMSWTETPERWASLRQMLIDEQTGG